jgi:hypothetical protein
MVEGALSPARLAYANRPRKANARSNKRGVSWLQPKGQCKAQLYGRGKRYVLGFFNTELDAAHSDNRHAPSSMVLLHPTMGQSVGIQATPKPLPPSP